jgi:hypothetical protein
MSDARLATWALASFHATFLVIAAVLIVFTRGGLGSLLASLNTLVGLGLFIALWVTTFFTTERALEGIDLAQDRDERTFARRAFRWGAANGMAFLAVLGLVLITGSMAATPSGGNPLGVLPIALFAAPFALVISAAVGAIAGAIFGVIDLVLVALGRSLSS